MSVELNHTIIWSNDRIASAAFFTEMYGLPDATDFGHFRVVQLSNGVSLDFADTKKDFSYQHYAMLVGDAEFDALYERIKAKGIRHWADPGRHRPGEINRNDGGKGVFFEGPEGHHYEAITVPYGGWPD